MLLELFIQILWVGFLGAVLQEVNQLRSRLAAVVIPRCVLGVAGMSKEECSCHSTALRWLDRGIGLRPLAAGGAWIVAPLCGGEGTVRHNAVRDQFFNSSRCVGVPVFKWPRDNVDFCVCSGMAPSFFLLLVGRFRAFVRGVMQK
eukprot:54099-Amphidinium_carterae.2